MIRLIKDKFYVGSNENVYIVDKDMCCNCKGFEQWAHCKHQKQVLDYIEKGKTVDTRNLF